MTKKKTMAKKIKPENISEPKEIIPPTNDIFNEVGELVVDVEDGHQGPLWHLVDTPGLLDQRYGVLEEAIDGLRDLSFLQVVPPFQKLENRDCEGLDLDAGHPTNLNERAKGRLLTTHARAPPNAAEYKRCEQ